MKQVQLSIELAHMPKYIPMNADVKVMFESYPTEFEIKDKNATIPYLADSAITFMFIDEDDILPEAIASEGLNENNCDIHFEVVERTNPLTNETLTGWAITKIKILKY